MCTYGPIEEKKKEKEAEAKENLYIA